MQGVVWIFLHHRLMHWVISAVSGFDGGKSNFKFLCEDSVIQVKLSGSRVTVSSSFIAASTPRRLDSQAALSFSSWMTCRRVFVERLFVLKRGWCSHSRLVKLGEGPQPPAATSRGGARCCLVSQEDFKVLWKRNANFHQFPEQQLFTTLGFSPVRLHHRRQEAARVGLEGKP